MSGEPEGDGLGWFVGVVIVALGMVVSYGMRSWTDEIAAGPDAVDEADPVPADNEGLVIRPSDEPAGGPSAEETPSAAASATRVLDDAARVLHRAGSFTYVGTVEASGASVTWPTGVSGGAVTVDGRVDLPGRSVERSTRPEGVVDTLVSGRGVWQRTAPTDTEVSSRPWTIVAQGQPALGFASLPDLVADAVPSGGAEPGEDGGRTVSALVPAVGIGDPAGPRPGRLDLDVDADGAPRRLALTVPAEPGASPTASLRLDVAIEDIGSAIDLGPPGEHELGITPPYSAAELVAAGLAAPVQFTRLPPGWVLTGVRLQAGDPTCPTLSMTYATVSGASDRLVLVGQDESCAVEDGALIVDPVPLAGPWVGLTVRQGSSGSRAVATDGTTRVAIRSSSLPEQVLVDLVSSLGPYDQLAQPSLAAGPEVPTLG